MAPFFPVWLHDVAIVSLSLAGVCAVVIAIDEIRRPQHMAVMNAVWPLTALFGSVIWLAVYWRWGRAPAPHAGHHHSPKPPRAVSVLTGTSHCGAGCMLGDLVVEWAAWAVPELAVWFGYGSFFAERTFAIWIPDFLLAFAIGIAFQYFAIQPMRHLSVGDGLKAALKADAISITAWQVGMYAGMAALQFGWFRSAFGGIAPVESPEFWWAMQIAMLAGFATAYPANWWLIARGVKEAM